MRKALEARLGAYPAQARLNRHTARATLPAAAAAVLAAEPALAAPAVAAFYERDVQDMAAAARQRRFPPEVIYGSAIFSCARLVCALLLSIENCALLRVRVKPLPRASWGQEQVLAKVWWRSVPVPCGRRW